MEAIQTPLDLPSPAVVESLMPVTGIDCPVPSIPTQPSQRSRHQVEGRRGARRTPLPLPDASTREKVAAPFAMYQSLADIHSGSSTSSTPSSSYMSAKTKRHSSKDGLRDAATPIGKIRGGVVPSSCGVAGSSKVMKAPGTPGGVQKLNRQLGGGRSSGAFNLDLQSSMLFNRRTAI